MRCRRASRRTERHASSQHHPQRGTESRDRTPQRNHAARPKNKNGPDAGRNCMTHSDVGKANISRQTDINRRNNKRSPQELIRLTVT